MSGHSVDAPDSPMEGRPSPQHGETSLEGFAADGSALAAKTTRIEYEPDTPLPQTSKEKTLWSTDDWRVLDVWPFDVGNESVVMQRNLDRLLVVKSAQGELTVVDESTGRTVVDLQGDVSGSIETWAVSPHGMKIAVVFEDPDRFSRNAHIRQWSLSSGEQLAAPMSELSVTWNPLVAYRQDGQVLAIADDDELRLWDAQSGLALTEPLPFVAGESHGRGMKKLWFTSKGERLYVARGSSIWVFPLAELVAEIPPDDELVRWSRILSAHYVDEAGGYVPLSDTEIREAASELFSSVRSRLFRTPQ